jgi:hypothetical protein
LVDGKPIGAALNRNLGSPTAPGEAVEAELSRLIEGRSRQKDPDEESELWQASVRAYEEKRRQAEHASSGISTTRLRPKGSAEPWRRWQATMRSRRQS